MLVKRGLAASSKIMMITLFQLLIRQAASLNICLAGGTGKIGQGLVGQLAANSNENDSITILTRNAFLAKTPTRVSEDYGWMGEGFLKKYGSRCSLRDWDGGDLLDIVGQDWLGWQQDVLPKTNIMVHLVGGGFAPHRVMACERLVRETQSFDMMYHITVNPSEDLLRVVSPGLLSTKMSRIHTCEEMVKENCQNKVLLRIGEYKVESACRKILDTIDDIRIEIGS